MIASQTALISGLPAMIVWKSVFSDSAGGGGRALLGARDAVGEQQQDDTGEEVGGVGSEAVFWHGRVGGDEVEVKG